MTDPTPDEPDDSDALLLLYLDDHWAAAGGGRALAHRLHGNNTDTEWDARLLEVADAVTEDDRTLEDVRRALGATGGIGAVIKRTAAQVGEQVARLVPNRRLVRYSPLSRVLEAEGMLAGVSAKHRLWDALRSSVADLPALAPFDLDELVDRADQQIETLTAFHRFASREAFGPVADSTGFVDMRDGESDR